MASVNRVLLIGHLGQDCKLRHAAGGAPVASFSIACTETWRDREGQKQERVEWVNVVLWGRQAESLAEYLVKGKQVYVEGKLQTRKWEDRQGNTRYTTEVKSDRVVLLGGGGNGARRPHEDSAPSADETTAPDPITDDQIPF